METRFLVQHESCECKHELNESLCNSMQKWNHDQCRSGCKELDNWSSCKNDYMWNSVILVSVILNVIKHAKLNI